MSLAIRLYTLEDDGSAKRLAAARRERMNPGGKREPCPEWAGQRKRLAIILVRLRDRRPVGTYTARFEIMEFDKNGRQRKRLSSDGWWLPNAWQRKALREALAAEVGRPQDAAPTGPFRFHVLDPNPDPCLWCERGEKPIPGDGEWTGDWVHPTGDPGAPFTWCIDEQWVEKEAPRPTHIRLVPRREDR